MSVPRVIVIDGESGSVTDWAKRLGISRTAMVARVKAFVAPRRPSACLACGVEGHYASGCSTADALADRMPIEDKGSS